MKNWLLAGCFIFTVVWLSLLVITLPAQVPQLPAADELGPLYSFSDPSDILVLLPVDLVIGLGLLILLGIVLNLVRPTLPERKLTLPNWRYDGLVGSFVWILTAIGAGYASSKVLAHYTNDAFYFHWGSSLVLQFTMLFSVVLLPFGFGERLRLDPLSGLEDWLKSFSHGTVEYVRIYPVLFLTLFLNQLLVYYFNYTSAPTSYLFILSAGTPLKVVLLVALTCVLAPLIEELFFRGIIYRSFRGILGTRPAALAGATIFSLVHFEMQFFVPLFVLGYFLCVIYEKSGSIKVVITLHFLQNTLSLLIFHRLL